jgi:2-hydroxymuconate-semialdehyde hydrolase
MVPLTVARTAARRHGWPLRIVEDAAHVPHIEQPAAFCELLDHIVDTSRR